MMFFFFFVLYRFCSCIDSLGLSLNSYGAQGDFCS